MADDGTPLVDMLLRNLHCSDEDLGTVLLAIAIKHHANSLGISHNEISEDFATKIVERIPLAESSTASDAAIEKALHKAASGDFQTAGRLLREHLNNGAHQIAHNKIAAHYVPIGIKKEEQAKEFGARGANETRNIGVKNRRAVLKATKKILSERTTARRPSVRELAPSVARETGLSQDTVRRHLKKSDLDKLLG